MAAGSSGTSGLARRYAAALYGLAEDGGALDTVAADLSALAQALRSHDDLRHLVRSPLFGRAEQERALDRVLADAGADPLTRRFAAVVARHRRLFALGDIIAAFLAELARRRGEVQAEVVSARDLDDDEVRALDAALRRALGERIGMTRRVEPEILGGLVIRIGSRMIDSSLKSKLERLRHRLRSSRQTA
ncbi:MAG: F0F1 ATP synthase subunit delta [Alphaproteobacteria bacterium]